jgi:hypothetical protein
LTAELVWFEVTAARATEFFRTIRERIAPECEARAGLDRLLRRLEGP